MKQNCQSQLVAATALAFLTQLIFVSSNMYPENPEGTLVIVSSMNMGYMYDTARNRTHSVIQKLQDHANLIIVTTYYNYNNAVNVGFLTENIEIGPARR